MVSGPLASVRPSAAGSMGREGLSSNFPRSRMDGNRVPTEAWEHRFDVQSAEMKGADLNLAPGTSNEGPNGKEGEVTLLLKLKNEEREKNLLPLGSL